MKCVLSIIGTRPEAIKMAPVIKALAKDEARFRAVTCVTGQHRQILDQMLSFFQITPDIDLNLMVPNQTLASLTAGAMLSLSETIQKVQPDVILVQGDTTTAMIAGLAGFYAKVPVGHVEAGLRTNHRYNPFPEEINRRMLSILATYHYAPTSAAANALISERVPAENVTVTGNTVIDALLWTASRTQEPRWDFTLASSRYILVTAHRRENFGKPILDICQALKKIVARHDIDIIYPVHPNPNIRTPVYASLKDVNRIHLIEPLEYERFVGAMKGAYLLLSDSGGVQEEAPSLGKPVLVLRETTERPEAVEAGVARLVGTDTETVVEHVERLLNDARLYSEMANSSNPFGDGHAAERIVDSLVGNLITSQ
jgi:UDP-N-acetylglucosamine 2-epimerase (non-hydrolysing)